MIDMKILIFIPPSHFKDDPLNMAKLFFDKHGINYTISSYTSHECIGSQGSTQKPDINTNQAISSDYDGMLIVGGTGIERYKLNEFRPLLDLLLNFNKNNKKICAIGNSVSLIAKSNIIKDKKIAVAADKKLRDIITLFRGIPSDKSFEISGNITTISDREYDHLEEGMIAFISHLDAE